MTWNNNIKFIIYLSVNSLTNVGTWHLPKCQHCFKMSVFSAYVSASGVQYFDDAYVAGRKILGLSLY